jgi:hypothetical protein
MRLKEAGPFEMRPREVGPFEMRTVEVGPFEMRIAEGGLFQNGTTKIKAPSVGNLAFPALVAAPARSPSERRRYPLPVVRQVHPA